MLENENQYSNLQGYASWFLAQSFMLCGACTLCKCHMRDENVGSGLDVSSLGRLMHETAHHLQTHQSLLNIARGILQRPT